MSLSCLSESRRPWHRFSDRKGSGPHPQTFSLKSTQGTSLEPSQLSAKPHTSPWVLASPVLLCPTLHTLRRNALSTWEWLSRRRLWARSYLSSSFSFHSLLCPQPSADSCHSMAPGEARSRFFPGPIVHLHSPGLWQVLCTCVFIEHFHCDTVQTHTTHPFNTEVRRAVLLSAPSVLGRACHPRKKPAPRSGHSPSPFWTGRMLAGLTVDASGSLEHSRRNVGTSSPDICGLCPGRPQPPTGHLGHICVWVEDAAPATIHLQAVSVIWAVGGMASTLRTSPLPATTLP